MKNESGGKVNSAPTCDGQTAKSKSIRKPRHYDGQTVRHKNGTLSVYVAFPTPLIPVIGQVAKRLGMSRDDFLKQAIEAKLLREKSASLSLRRQAREQILEREPEYKRISELISRVVKLAGPPPSQVDTFLRDVVKYSRAERRAAADEHLDSGAYLHQFGMILDLLETPQHASSFSLAGKPPQHISDIAREARDWPARAILRTANELMKSAAYLNRIAAIKTVLHSRSN